MLCHDLSRFIMICRGGGLVHAVEEGEALGSGKVGERVVVDQGDSGGVACGEVEKRWQFPSLFIYNGRCALAKPFTNIWHIKKFAIIL